MIRRHPIWTLPGFSATIDPYPLEITESDAEPLDPLDHRHVTKMNGLGNEIMILDLRGSGLEVSARQARAIGRADGLVFDQLMVLHEPRSPDTDARMAIYNRDGSRAGACGNGTRCVAWFLCRDSGRDALVLETESARLACRRICDWSFSVEMGRPRLAWDEIPLREPCTDTRALDLGPLPESAAALGPPAVVSMGNPHAIFWVGDLQAHDLARLGPLLEAHPMFPERANISLAQVLGEDRIALAVWERGTGLTRACGSAACAAVVAGSRTGRTGRRASVSLPGGDLDIEWRSADDVVVMTGPVAYEFETVLDPRLFEECEA
jgi:diaminopimelate epimerase